MGFARNFLSSGIRQEVNIILYSQIEEPIKSREKHYSLVLQILNQDMLRLEILLGFTKHKI